MSILVSNAHRIYHNILQYCRSASEEEMRKTCLYWSDDQVQLLEGEFERLKALHAMYPQLIICESIPSQYTPREDYIRLTSSQCQPVYHKNLSSVIVYCLKLNAYKKEEIARRYNNLYTELRLTCLPTVHVTNNFSDLVKLVIKELGYEEIRKDSQSSVSSMLSRQAKQEEEQGIDKAQNRFQKDAQLQSNIKSGAEMALKQQFANMSNLRETQKLFKLDIPSIQKMQVGALCQRLQKQLKSYLKSKQIEPMDRQFMKIRQSKSLTELCRACLHFYTLQKYSLYQNLNLLLRNIRSVLFKQQFDKLKLFAFLLVLNYVYAYSGSYGVDEHSIPPLLYRYTDITIDPELTGQIITVPSFYSVSALEEISNFKTKLTKIIIHPLAEGNCSISLSSLYPIYLFSAFKKQKEYLYIPFTCFLVTQVRYKKSEQKWIVHLKEVPGNNIVQRILDANLFSDNTQAIKNILGKTQKNFRAEWQLKLQQRYEYSSDPIVKIKTSLNLGILFLRIMQNYEISINYFNQTIQLILKLMKSDELRRLSHTATLLKAHNYLGLAYLNQQKIQKSDEAFKKAEKYMNQLLKMQPNKLTKSETKGGKQQHNVDLTYLNAALKNNRAYWYENQYKYVQASNKYKEALNMVQQCPIKNQLMEACLFNNIGACLGKIQALPSELKQNGNIKLAFQFLLKSFNKYTQIYGISIAYPIQSPSKLQHQDISKKKDIPEQQPDHPQKQLYRLTKYLSETKIIVSQLMTVMQNCSQQFQKVNNIQKSIFFQQSAIQLYKKSDIIQEKQSVTLMYMKSRMAKLLVQTGQYKQSISIYKEALPTARLVDETGLKSAMFKSNIASAYVNMGSDEDFRMAVHWYNQSIKDISSPLLNQNLSFYNKICDLKTDIEKYLQIIEKQARK